jgi:hypothetical protein
MNRLSWVSVINGEWAAAAIARRTRLGLSFVWRHRTSAGGAFIERAEKWPYTLFFLGAALTCFGSGYYHLAPNDDRLGRLAAV